MSVAEVLTVGATLGRAALRFGAHTAIVMGPRRLSYRELFEQARRVGASLRGIGIRPGDHVGIVMANCIDYLLLFYGCALLGARPVHLNSRYKREELEYVIADADIRVLFTSAGQREVTGLAGMLRDIYPELRAWRGDAPLAIGKAPRLGAVYFCDDQGSDDPGDGRDNPNSRSWPGTAEFAAAAAGHEGYAENADPEQIGLIMYTSGTTARPKACLLSHRALEYVGRGLAERWHMTHEDCFWDPLPFFHMSTMVPLAACRYSGAAFIAVEHFDAGAALRQIEAERATILFPAFPTLTNALFSHPDFDPGALGGVRIVNNVGPPDLLRRFAARLPAAAHVSAYGLTEAGGVIAFNAPDDSPDQRAETAGRPFPGVEVQIVNPDTLEPVAPGATGEILIRGPTLFSGYYNDDQQTRAVMAPGGWLRSGDLGALDGGGRIRYLGRLKDMLKVGGENVAAIEIEGYLCTHPAVKVAQVVSAPDERLIEVPAVFIELHENSALTARDVVEYCHGRIASFKIPRYVRFVREWPMSATKIQKFRLRELIDAADRIEPGRPK